MSARGSTSPGFLGTGWSFPPSFSSGGQDVAMVSDVEDIHQSLQVLLSTRRGERPMQESFGCSLDELLFEPADHATVSRIAGMISDAVLEHETRIKLCAVDVSPDKSDAGILRVRIEYTVRDNNSRFNMVFPFYLNEATAPASPNHG